MADLEEPLLDGQAGGRQTSCCRGCLALDFKGYRDLPNGQVPDFRFTQAAICEGYREHCRLRDQHLLNPNSHEFLAQGIINRGMVRDFRNFPHALSMLELYRLRHMDPDWFETQLRHGRNTPAEREADDELLAEATRWEEHRKALQASTIASILRFITHSEAIALPAVEHRPVPKGTHFTEVLSDPDLLRLVNGDESLMLLMLTSDPHAPEQKNISERRLRQVRDWEQRQIATIAEEKRTRRSQHLQVVIVCIIALIVAAGAGLRLKAREQSELRKEEVNRFVDIFIFIMACFFYFCYFFFPKVLRAFSEWLIHTLDSDKFCFEGYFYSDRELWENRTWDWRFGRFPSICGSIWTIPRRTQRKTEFTILVILGAVSLFGSIVCNAAEWKDHLQKLQQLDFHKRLHSDDGPLENLVGIINDPYALCNQFGQVPVPYSIMVVNAVIGGWVLDVAFGFPDLSQEKVRNGPVSNPALLYIMFNVGMVILSWHMGLSKFAGDTHWLELTAFYTTTKTTAGALVLTCCKLLCEINCQPGTGVPPTWSRKEWVCPGRQKGNDNGPTRWMPWKTWTMRIHLFYICLVALLVNNGPLFVIYGLPTLLVALFGLTVPVFGFWGWLCGWLLENKLGVLANTGIDWTDAFYHMVSLHSKFWQGLAVIGTLTVLGMLLRKWCWEIHTRVRLWRTRLSTTNPAKGPVPDSYFNDIVATPPKKGEPHGPYGFNTACYTVSFAIPIVALTNALCSTGVALLDGDWKVGENFMGDFAMRQLYPYFQCMASSPMLEGATSFLGSWL